MFEELNIPITVEEIRKGLKQLKNGASAGPDLILNEFLKHGTNGLLHYLHNLYITNCLKQGTFQKVGHRVT